MSAETHELKHDAGGSPVVTASTLTGIAAVALVVLLAAMWSGSAVPVIAAALVAALVPKTHGASVRVPMAAIAGLLALFVVRYWPAAAAAEGAAPSETGHTLTWLVGLPLAGAVAILFAPRQAKGGIQTMTLGIMAATLVAALPILGVHMGRTYHFNE